MARLPRLTLVVGKGGVGKTTLAVGIAARFAAAGESTLLVSTDPAGALGNALGITLAEGEKQTIAGCPRLTARQLDARSARREFLARWRQTIVTIVDRGTYLDLDDIEGLVDAAFPGADEIFALLALAELVSGERDVEEAVAPGRLVVDTAPTGHTLRLLALPETFEMLVALLETMQSKHRFMVGALTHRYRRDRADEFLDQMRAEIAALRAVLTDAGKSAAVLVARPEPVVIAETVRYASALRAMEIAIAAIVLNAVPAEAPETERQAIVEIANRSPVFELPRIEPSPAGATGIAGALGAMRTVAPSIARGKRPRRGAKKRLRGDDRAKVALFLGGAPRATGERTAAGPGSRDHAAAPLELLRTLTISGGKGGVGKTTVSCALAIAAVSSSPLERDVLLVSTDPAPSIADALSIADQSWSRSRPESVDGVPGLVAWQMDAAAAFGQLRDRYQERIDALFDAFVGRGIDATHDRAILRQLLALAPPGIDELYALASLGEALAEGRFERIIVDPAPTGHLLRLVEMPALALEWSHRLMRLMLKYKDVAGLGDAAEELLGFSRRTRALEALLSDPLRAGVVLVTLDEPLVRAESLRLAAALAGTHVAVVGVVRNRVTDSSIDQPLTLDPVVPTVIAPASHTPLVGVTAIREWYARWRVEDEPRRSSL